MLETLYNMPIPYIVLGALALSCIVNGLIYCITYGFHVKEKKEQKSLYKAVIITDKGDKLEITDWGNGIVDFVSRLTACAWKPKKILSVKYLNDFPLPKTD